MWIVSEGHCKDWEGDSLKIIAKDIAERCAQDDSPLPHIESIIFLKEDGTEREFAEIVGAFEIFMESHFEYYQDAFNSDKAYRQDVRSYYNSTRL